MGLQHAYVSSVLTQDASYFDLHGAGEIATRAGKDINSIRIGFGEKMGYAVWSLSTLLAAIISSFANAPRMAGVLFVVIPFLFIVFGILAWLTEAVGTPALRLEGLAGSLLEQILSSVRVVQSFGMERSLLARLDGELLERLERYGMGKAAVRATGMAAIYFTLTTTYALAFHWGSVLVVEDGLAVGTLMTSFWNMFNALFAIANVVPHIGGIFDAYVSLQLLRTAIEREPCIDVRSTGGTTLDSPLHAPSIELRNVTFAYPSRNTVASLRNVSMRIEGGKVTAFVGPSGSGKSTIASLLLREYDPIYAANPVDEALKKLAHPANSDEEDEKKKKQKSGWLGWLRGKKEKPATAGPTDGGDSDLESIKKTTRVEGGGEVLFAEHNVRDLNLSWLRAQISVVQQHPSIFTCSVLENVAAGLTGTDLVYRPDVDSAPDADEATRARTAIIRARVEEALQKAQALDFVRKLPDGLETAVSGGRTGVLSGGQRQRIALARALIGQPAVLILDEATSALDSATEDRIREMLAEEQRARGMTTVIIAHRLSTIRHADTILVMRNGKLIEQGTHDELMGATGDKHTYRDMVSQQRAMIDADDGETSEEEEAKELRDETPASTPEAVERHQLTSQAPPSTVAPLYEPPQQRRPELAALGPKQSRDHTWSSPGFSGRAMMSTVEHATAKADAASSTEEEPLARVKSTPVSLTDPPAEAGADLPGVSMKEVLRAFIGYFHKFQTYFIIGAAGAIAVGASFPLAGWMTGEAVSTLSIANDPSRLRSETDRWALFFFILALADVVLAFINSFFLETGSERIMRTLKKRGLAALLRQETGFFDAEDQASGGLTAAVSNHPAAVGAATGAILSQLIISAINMLGSVVLAFILSWKIAVVCLSPMVLLFISGYLNVAMLEKFEARAQKPMDRAASYVSENMDSIKTVAALGREAETMRTFDVRAKADKSRIRYLLVGSAGFAFSQAMVLWISALVFFWAGELFGKGEISLATLYSAFEAIIIGSFSAGRIFTFIPDYSRAFASLRTVSSWLKREPRLASVVPSDAATKLGADTSNPMAGDITFDQIEMRYPTRPKHPALRELTLTLRAGQRTAFCGTSGSGKSSILSLLQRFYDPSRGTLSFGGVDSRAIPLEELRAKMAYVSQDPVLFSGTIFWNLAMGAVDPSTVTREDVEQACDQACILDFVRGLPDGFDTDIGFKGAQLSGGQKQRLCIARALMRRPEILILDEATSALDNESEAAVQAALDRASIGRTTVVVAHRLTTIRNSHLICVIEDGACVEAGSHSELLRRKGRYLELIEAQL